jgi:nitrogen regulatory protein P-II 1
LFVLNHFEEKQDLQAKVMVAWFGLLAEVEGVLIPERTRKGLASARAKGALGKSRLDGKEEKIRLLLQSRLQRHASPGLSESPGPPFPPLSRQGGDTHLLKRVFFTHHGWDPKKEEDMKKIEAIIRPVKVDDVNEALTELGIEGMTTIDVKRFRRQEGHIEIYRASEYSVDFIPKVLVSVIVADAVVENAVKAIVKAAKTGEIGDGSVSISTVDEVLRIRTGEKAI